MAPPVTQRASIAYRTAMMKAPVVHAGDETEQARVRVGYF
ncbi:hypothetical protein M595_0034 [Lyngbya aestuarii BL J]|uniref:Uncharacterized protein n=1 Tax=Lyngbya aestuarii BL J TaxID=1348334 RepID=U7QRW8_9CYAN|nr:hypothetical protein M595_0034 [Lyngbya aestuarii BL J]